MWHTSNLSPSEVEAELSEVQGHPQFVVQDWSVQSQPGKHENCVKKIIKIFSLKEGRDGERVRRNEGGKEGGRQEGRKIGRQAGLAGCGLLSRTAYYRRGTLCVLERRDTA